MNLLMEQIPLISGRGSSLIILLLLIAFFFIGLRLAKIGRPPKIRRLPALDAIDEAIGRCAEMGKHALFTPGLTGTLDSHQGPQMVSAITILGYIAEGCAKYDVPLIVDLCQGDALPLIDETLRLAYLKQGKPEKYDPKMVNYFPGQSPMVTGILGHLQRLRPAAFFMLGGLYYESVVIGEAANFVGAITIGGTVNTHQLPFIVAVCDYVLIGEEFYAAGAYLSKDPYQIATISGEDWIKFILAALLILGFILEPLGIKIISSFLRW
ncbi:MAG: hypothetical protein N3E39_00505 [Candidatus Methanomethylicia archaeon]|nr:hypothetical protein [Candidatus Methanomethylicia archaeon]